MNRLLGGSILEQCYKKIGNKEIGIDVFMHSQRVAIYTKKLVQNMEYNSTQIDSIVMAALNHDIGKCEISRSILNKEDKLTSREFEEIKKHAEYSASILQKYKCSSYLTNIVSMHHENYDGSGYYNIKGDKIPLESRILRITDVYDALTSNRCYRKAYSKEEALIIMEKEKQIYDANILAHFFRIMSKEYGTNHAF